MKTTVASFVNNMVKSIKKNKITFLILVIIILCILISIQKEGFHNPFYHQFYEHHFDPYYGYPTRTYPTRFFSPTRNMSYDLRGDPNIYYTVRIGPWGESVILPQYRYRESIFA